MNSIFGAGMAYDMMVMKESEKQKKDEQASKNDSSKNKNDDENR